MIPYLKNSEKTIATSSVKIIGLGGAGANMLERIALEGMDGPELLALNTDIRTLGSCMAKEKIQLGANLTKGLGAGGDPELGQKAVLEAENEIRASLKGRRIVFVCVGLGGGTGSGAAPIVTRIAREEGAFVVVFATIPFGFEGQRRRDQAETTLNELAVLSNALVTFDNNRMGELVLAKQGIHEAFAAADQMISESIKAVIRLVIRPGLINVGLDDLMSALRTNRSRCLFGSGLAEGKDRASKALRNALASPLLERGSLLKEAQTVLVHLCGGENLTLFEIELLMQNLQKFVPDSAHVLFGAAVDPLMGDSLSLTLISALPEESLAMAPRNTITQADNDDRSWLEDSEDTRPETATVSVKDIPHSEEVVSPTLFENISPYAEEPSAPKEANDTTVSLPEMPSHQKLDVSPISSEIKIPENSTTSDTPSPNAPYDMPMPVQSSEVSSSSSEKELPIHGSTSDALQDKPNAVLNAAPASTSNKSIFKIIPKTLPSENSFNITPDTATFEKNAQTPVSKDQTLDVEVPKLKLGIKTSSIPQNELSLDSTPRGKFEGESPNVFDGEDLDLPPFLRKKKS